MEWFAALFIRLAVMALLAGAAELLVPEGALRGAAATAVGIAYRSTKPSVIEGREGKIREDEAVTIAGSSRYDVSMNAAIGFGCLITCGKSRIETLMPFTRVRNAKSHVTRGLSGRNIPDSSRPRMTPPGVRTGI